MDRESYKISIEELTTIRDEIDSRIQVLREENGLTLSDTFEEILKKTLEELEIIIDDRSENDDDQSLWTILTELRRLEENIISSLRADYSE